MSSQRLHPRQGAAPPSVNSSGSIPDVPALMTIKTSRLCVVVKNTRNGVFITAYENTPPTEGLGALTAALLPTSKRARWSAASFSSPEDVVYLDEKSAVDRGGVRVSCFATPLFKMLLTGHPHQMHIPAQGCRTHDAAAASDDGEIEEEEDSTLRLTPGFAPTVFYLNDVSHTLELVTLDPLTLRPSSSVDTFSVAGGAAGFLPPLGVSVSPDHRVLAFVVNGDLWLDDRTNSGAAHQVQLPPVRPFYDNRTVDVRAFVFSPDSAFVVALAQKGQTKRLLNQRLNQRLFIVHVATGIVRPVDLLLFQHNIAPLLTEQLTRVGSTPWLRQSFHFAHRCSTAIHQHLLFCNVIVESELPRLSSETELAVVDIRSGAVRKVDLPRSGVEKAENILVLEKESNGKLYAVCIGLVSGGGKDTPSSRGLALVEIETPNFDSSSNEEIRTALVQLSRGEKAAALQSDCSPFALSPNGEVLAVACDSKLCLYRMWSGDGISAPFAIVDIGSSESDAPALVLQFLTDRRLVAYGGNHQSAVIDFDLQDCGRKMGDESIVLERVEAASVFNPEDGHSFSVVTAGGSMKRIELLRFVAKKHDAPQSAASAASKKSRRGH